MRKRGRGEWENIKNTLGISEKERDRQRERLREIEREA